MSGSRPSCRGNRASPSRIGNASLNRDSVTSSAVPLVLLDRATWRSFSVPRETRDMDTKTLVQSDPRSRPKPFTFRPPKRNRLVIGFCKRVLPFVIRRKLKVTEIEIGDDDLEGLKALRSKRCLLMPSHSGDSSPISSCISRSFSATTTTTWPPWRLSRSRPSRVGSCSEWGLIPSFGGRPTALPS